MIGAFSFVVRRLSLVVCCWLFVVWCLFGPGAMLADLEGNLGPAWASVGPSWGYVDRSGGPILGLCWPMLGLGWPIWRPKLAHVDPS